MKAKAEGADIRMVYSTLDAIKIAEREPQREVVFFAIGFETTTPPTALAIARGAQKGLKNFSVICNHVMTPPAMTRDPRVRAARQGVLVEGFVGPAHVSTIIGTKPYEPFAHDYHKPVVVAGFEPLDVAQAILMLVRQINDGRSEVENQYIRAVTCDGNCKAQAEIAEIFELRDTFRMARPRLAARQRAEAAREPGRDSTPSGVSASSRRAGQGQSGLRMRRDPARRQEAARVQAVRHALHARHADGLLHGLAGGRLLRALDLRAVPRDASREQWSVA